VPVKNDVFFIEFIMDKGVNGPMTVAERLQSLFTATMIVIA